MGGQTYLRDCRGWVRSCPSPSFWLQVWGHAEFASWLEGFLSHSEDNKWLPLSRLDFAYQAFDLNGDGIISKQVRGRLGLALAAKQESAMLKSLRVFAAGTCVACVAGQCMLYGSCLEGQHAPRDWVMQPLVLARTFDLLHAPGDQGTSSTLTR